MHHESSQVISHAFSDFRLPFPFDFLQWEEKLNTCLHLGESPHQKKSVLGV